LLKGMIKNKRGISPVVATVILVAVTIVVAVAVSYWMGGITGLYTRFEKVEMTSAYSTWNGTGAKWTVSITMKNTGSMDATIDNILINGRPYNDALYGGNVTDPDPALPIPLPIGDNVPISFDIIEGPGFRHGVNIDVKLHSASGQEYPKTILLV